MEKSINSKASSLDIAIKLITLSQDTIKREETRKTRKGIGKSLEMSLNERLANSSVRLYNGLLHSNRTNHLCAKRHISAHQKKKVNFYESILISNSNFQKIFYHFQSPNKLFIS